MGEAEAVAAASAQIRPIPAPAPVPRTRQAIAQASRLNFGTLFDCVRSLPGSTSLRSIAIVWVMLFHSFVVGGPGRRGHWLSRYMAGWGGSSSC